MATSTIERPFGRPIVSITVTAGTNVVIDVNKSYRKGEVGFLAVKGHASAAVTNGALFTFDAQKALAQTQITFPVGIGGEWNITGAGYGFLGSNNVVGTVASGQYFHILIPLLFSV